MFISDKIYVELSLAERAHRDLCEAFTYSNPEFHKKKRMGYSIRGVAPSICNYKYHQQDGVKYIVLPRGGLSKVKDLLFKNNVPARFIDKRTSSNASIDFNLNSSIELSSNQQRIIAAFHANSGGLVQMAPGGGKTISCLGFVSDIKKRALIIVHTSMLQKQWLDELTQKCSGNFTIGRLDGKKKVDGDIVVAVIDSLYVKCELDKETPDFSYLNSFDIVIQDECHHASARSFKAVLDNFSGVYKLGVTGTPTRKDGMHFLMFDTFGEISVAIGDNELKDRITDFEYEFVVFPGQYHVPGRKFFRKSQGGMDLDYNQAIDFLINSEERNNLILNKVSNDINNGYKVLVLTYRTEHAYTLYNSLKEKYKGHLIIGDVTSKIDFQAIRADMEFQFIVANRAIAEEGLDIPHLSSLHIVLPSTNMQKIKQQLGRIRRFFDGKNHPKLTDYKDTGVTCSVYDTSGSVSLVNILEVSAKKRESFYIKLRKEYHL